MDILIYLDGQVLPFRLTITPLRWAVSTAIPVLVVKWGHGKQSLSTSGAFLALIVGFFMSLANFSFFLCLLMFFISSSKVTKFKADEKKRFEAEFKEGGQRNWLQVLCNGGMALELSLLYLLDVGSADLPVDFREATKEEKIENEWKFPFSTLTPPLLFFVFLGEIGGFLSSFLMNGKCPYA